MINLNLKHLGAPQSYHSLILANSLTFPVPSLTKTTLKFLAIPTGKLCGEAEARPSSFSPIPGLTSSDAEHKTAKVISVTDLLYDDPEAPYVPLPEHNLDQSPCYPIIAIKERLLTRALLISYYTTDSI